MFKIFRKVSIVKKSYDALLNLYATNNKLVISQKDIDVATKLQAELVMLKSNENSFNKVNVIIQDLANLLSARLAILSGDIKLASSIIKENIRDLNNLEKENIDINRLKLKRMYQALSLEVNGAMLYLELDKYIKQSAGAKKNSVVLNKDDNKYYYKTDNGYLLLNIEELIKSKENFKLIPIAVMEPFAYTQELNDQFVKYIKDVEEVTELIRTGTLTESEKQNITDTRKIIYNDDLKIDAGSFSISLDKLLIPVYAILMNIVFYQPMPFKNNEESDDYKTYLQRITVYQNAYIQYSLLTYNKNNNKSAYLDFEENDFFTGKNILGNTLAKSAIILKDRKSNTHPIISKWIDEGREDLIKEKFGDNILKQLS